MDILTHLLTVLVTFSAIPIGYLLAALTKEELKPGRKTFMMIGAACLAAIAISIIYFLTNEKLVFSLILFFCAGYLFVKAFENRPLFWPVYSALLLILLLSFSVEESSFLIATFIFIFCLATVALKKAR